jgi:hypothetical protein
MRRSSTHSTRPTITKHSLAIQPQLLLPLHTHMHPRPSTTTTTDSGRNRHLRRPQRSINPRCRPFQACLSLLVVTSRRRKQVNRDLVCAFPTVLLTQVAAAQSPQSQQRQSSSPPLRLAPSGAPGAMQQPPQPQAARTEHSTVFAPSSTSAANSRMTLPPTPPMQPDVAHDGNQSPSAASTHSAGSVPYFSGSLNNMEPHQQRQSLSSVASLKRDSLPSHSMSPYSASVYGQSPYTSSPGGASATSFYSPEQHSYSNLGMYSQRPLPSNFQPQAMPLPVPVPSPAPSSSNPWQHHHYISTSSQAQFPQSQDRYICSTCNKAFSRPSSLRIHSHSHTGEKPYKCPQPGCGKAFSVRSNMKRHERGCHAATSTTLTT